MRPFTCDFRLLFVFMAVTTIIVVMWSEWWRDASAGQPLTRKEATETAYLPPEFTLPRNIPPEVERVMGILHKIPNYEDIFKRDPEVHCQFPLDDPLEEQSMKHYEAQELQCVDKEEGFATMSANGILTATKSPDRTCHFYEINRSNRTLQLEFSGKTPLVGGIRPQSDFVRVDCLDGKGTVKSRDFFAFAQPRFKSIRQYKKMSEISVAVIGIGSMSRLNFMRQMPESYSYLKTHLGSIEMLGFHQVGFGSHANLMAMLKGRLGFTQLKLIWEYFSKVGAATMFADDGQTINPPQRNLPHHFGNTFWSAVLNSQKKRQSSKFCLGKRPNYTLHLDYLLSFARSYRNNPKFLFSVYSELGHSFNNAQVMDEGFRYFLKSMKNEGLLDRTILFIMSDQGTPMTGIASRHGTTETVAEETMPLLSIVLPTTAPKHWRKLLMINQKKLTSSFDLHQTFVDALELLNPPESVVRYLRSVSSGRSIFSDIPTNRSCSDAQVPDHLCMCSIKRQR